MSDFSYASCRVPTLIASFAMSGRALDIVDASARMKNKSVLPVWRTEQ